MQKKTVEVYVCDYCGKIFLLDEEEKCKGHEMHHEKKKKWENINRLWKEGMSLGEINDTYAFIPKLSEDMRGCTKDSTVIYHYDSTSSFISGNIVEWGYDFSKLLNDTRKGLINMKRFKNVKLEHI